MDIDISFVVICYNQESYILMALESLKYQLEHFKTNESIQLIVADDGSTDQTTEFAEKWLNANEGLFDEVTFLAPKENRGTCKNLTNALRKVHGIYIHILSGDDLCLNVNVLGALQEIDVDEIVACPPIRFVGESMIADREAYLPSGMAKFQSVKSLVRASKHSTPVGAGALVGKQFFDEEILAFCERFALLEDQARWTKAFEKYREFKYRFSDKPVYLYRMRDRQEAAVYSSKQRSTIEKDRIELARYVVEHEKNPITKLSAHMSAVSWEDWERYKKYYRYFNPAGWQWKIVYARHKKELEQIAGNIVTCGKELRVDDYIQEIKQRVAAYGITAAGNA